jgi:hypothetical protein
LVHASALKKLSCRKREVAKSRDDRAVRVGNGAQCLWQSADEKTKNVGCVKDVVTVNDRKSQGIARAALAQPADDGVPSANGFVDSFTE